MWIIQEPNTLELWNKLHTQTAHTHTTHRHTHSPQTHTDSPQTLFTAGQSLIKSVIYFQLHPNKLKTSASRNSTGALESLSCTTAAPVSLTQILLRARKFVLRFPLIPSLRLGRGEVTPINLLEPDFFF